MTSLKLSPLEALRQTLTARNGAPQRFALGLFIALAIGCGPTTTQTDPQGRTKEVPTIKRDKALEFEPFVKSFEDEYFKDASPILMLLTDDVTPATAVGTCDGGYTVRIRTSFWLISSTLTKKALIYHELGHCLLRRGHNDTTYTDGCPKSIMNPYLVTDSCYTSHLNELDYELGVGK